MTIQEISDRFDYQFQKSTTGPSLDEYNKSLYLTKSQYAFVTATISSYEYGDAMRQILKPILVTESPTKITSAGPFAGTVFPSATDVLAIVYEVSEFTPVIPLDTNDVHEVLKNPFKQPDKNIAYRVTYDDRFEIIRVPKSDKYSYIYIKEPEPIILLDLPDNLTIKGKFKANSSVFKDSIVVSIIDLAVSSALNDIKQLAPPPQQQGPQQ